MNTPFYSTWQAALTNQITDPKDLFLLLNLPNSLLDAAYAASIAFPLKTTHSFVARMRKGDINDPLLQQILPLGRELELKAGYDNDPLKEKAANPLPGLLHKYHGRVLVTLTSACAVNCRFCFRRHFPYQENNPGRRGWENIFSYIRQDDTISEVILSGGDPLSVSDQLLMQFCEQLATIPHVKYLRFHSRLPVVLPQRITQAFVDWLRNIKFSVVMVIHMNHANEMNAEVASALSALREAGVTLLNQSVLLKGINDNVEALVALSETLFAEGVLSYYLHVLDKVQGVAHFDLPLEQAQALHAELVNRLPGYLVPKLVREDAGKLAKTNL